MQQRKKSWFGRLFSDAKPILKWLKPGIGVKRYFFVLLGGTTLLGVGLTLLILDVYRSAPDTWWLPLFSALSLRELERPIRVLIFGGIGLGLLIYGVMGLSLIHI